MTIAAIFCVLPVAMFLFGYRRGTSDERASWLRRRQAGDP